MNNKGFTLVEVIAVIALLGLVIIITSTGILGGGSKAKEKMLETKIKNIEKAAVLYGQDYRHKINLEGSDPSNHPLCYKNGSLISNCYYYFNDKNNNNAVDYENYETIITVGFLADNPDGDLATDDAYLEYDDKVNEIIKNPVDKNKSMNDCEIQIYQKYGKIYADFIEEIEDDDDYNGKCWK